MTALAPRWPVSALLDATGLSVQQVAVAAGRCRRTGIRWAQSDTLNDRQADHAACAVGLHPALVWPDWFAAAPAHVTDPPPRNHVGGVTHETLTLNEAATILNTTRDAVERLVETGVLERLRWKYDRRVFVSHASVREWQAREMASC